MQWIARNSFELHFQCLFPRSPRGRLGTFSLSDAWSDLCQLAFASPIPLHLYIRTSTVGTARGVSHEQLTWTRKAVNQNAPRIRSPTMGHDKRNPVLKWSHKRAWHEKAVLSVFSAVKSQNVAFVLGMSCSDLAVIFTHFLYHLKVQLHVRHTVRWWQQKCVRKKLIRTLERKS